VSSLPILLLLGECETGENSRDRLPRAVVRPRQQAVTCACCSALELLIARAYARRIGSAGQVSLACRQLPLVVASDHSHRLFRLANAVEQARAFLLATLAEDGSTPAFLLARVFAADGAGVAPFVRKQRRATAISPLCARCSRLDGDGGRPISRGSATAVDDVPSPRRSITARVVPMCGRQRSGETVVADSEVLSSPGRFERHLRVGIRLAGEVGRLGQPTGSGFERAT